MAEEKRFRGKAHRPVLYYGIEELRRGPLVVPGTYTVKLSVNGKEIGSQSVTVLKDPASAGTPEDIASAAKLSVALYEDINAAAGMLNQLEWSRKQLEDLRKMLADAKEDPAGTASADEMEKKLRGVEDTLLQHTITEEDVKSFRGALGIYLKLLWLQAECDSGGADVSGSADLAPTKAEQEVHALLSGQLAETRKRFDSLYAQDVAAFNESMGKKGYARIMTVQPPEEPRREKAGEEEEDDDGDWGGD